MIMEGDTYHTPAHEKEDLDARIRQRNLQKIATPDPELEADLLQYCQDPETSDDMTLLTVDRYDDLLGDYLALWRRKPASFILQEAIRHEKEGKLPAANILYKMADTKKQNYEAMMSEKRTDTTLWQEYALNAQNSEEYEAHQAFKKKLLDFCRCIKHPRTQEAQGHY